MEEKIAERYRLMKPYLNERTKRIFLSVEATSQGWGGIKKVAEATGVHRNTISEGCKELREPKRLDKKRVRKPGGGRREIIEKDQTLLSDLEFLIEPTTRGDPMSPLRWTCKSTRNLAKELIKMGHKISHTRVAELLHQMDYSLQANKKTLEGNQHKDRNAQFKNIYKKCKEFMNNNQPIISVDTKKKENVGNYKNDGKEWQPQGNPEKVKGHDFPDKKLGKVSPFGVYDTSNNKGFVNLGTDYDTSAFAVESIRRWWYMMGQFAYPNAKALLITADSGGSNGYRRKLWKIELQKLADETGMSISLCHFPPGTSKWNKIEHRMFSFISQNWRGKPLISHEVIINLIANTTTEKGLEIQCVLDENKYPKGIKISDKELAKVNIKREDFHGEWNYTIEPSVGNAQVVS